MFHVDENKVVVIRDNQLFNKLSCSKCLNCKRGTNKEGLECSWARNLEANENMVLVTRKEKYPLGYIQYKVYKCDNFIQEERRNTNSTKYDRKIGNEVKERYSKIISLLKKYNMVTTKFISSELGINMRMAKRDLQYLRDNYPQITTYKRKYTKWSDCVEGKGTI